MKQAITITSTVVLTVLAVDFMFFAMWVLSGQQPADGFYFGAITANIIKAILL